MSRCRAHPTTHSICKTHNTFVRALREFTHPQDAAGARDPRSTSCGLVGLSVGLWSARIRLKGRIVFLVLGKFTLPASKMVM